MDVLPALEDGVTSMRCLDQLRLVRQAAGNLAEAREFCARFDAVEQTLTALAGDEVPAAEAGVPA
jgi:hypothetical protein